MKRTLFELEAILLSMAMLIAGVSAVWDPVRELFG